MYGREKLYYFTAKIETYCFQYDDIDVYDKNKADTVMDAMEARIKELENQLEDVQHAMVDKITALDMENFKLKERIKELEAKSSTVYVEHERKTPEPANRIAELEEYCKGVQEECVVTAIHNRGCVRMSLYEFFKNKYNTERYPMINERQFDELVAEIRAESSERIKELEAENGQLKKDLEHARSYKHTIKMRNRNLQAANEALKRRLRFEKKSQAELWRDKAEKLAHEKHPDHFDHDDHISNNRELVSANNGYNPLKMFYEIAEKYFSTSTPQDLENVIKKQRETNVIVHKDYIQHLREENERLAKDASDYHQLQWQHDALIDEHNRLKAELDREAKLMDCWSIEGLATITENNQALRAENAKLRCLALHAMREYFKAMSTLNTWREEYYGEPKYLHRVIHYDKLAKQYNYAYRKAMLTLMEEK